jgi:hypothetical protein
LGAALGHLGETVAQQVQFGVDGLLGGQLGIGVAFGGDQLASDLGGTDPGEEPIGLKLGIGLTLTVGDAADIFEESSEMFLGGLATSAVEGIHAGHAGPQLVRPLADRLPTLAQILLGPALSTPADRSDSLRHEDSLLATLESLGGVDEDGDHLGVGSHLRSSSVS